MTLICISQNVWLPIVRIIETKAYCTATLLQQRQCCVWPENAHFWRVLTIWGNLGQFGANWGNFWITVQLYHISESLLHRKTFLWQFWAILGNFGQSLANGPIVPSLFIIVIQTKAYCTAKLSCNKDSTVCNQKMHISSQWKLFEIFHPASLTYVKSNSASTFSMFYKKQNWCWHPNINSFEFKTRKNSSETTNIFLYPEFIRQRF